MAYRTEAHNTDTARNGAEAVANRGELESTKLRERPADSGASREQLAPFAPYLRQVQVLPPRSPVRENAPNRESTPRPNRSAFHRGRMTVIRLWGVWWSCRDFRPRPHTQPHTKERV